MISIGGVDAGLATNYKYWTQPDPMLQGLGVFDLSAMVWRDGYDNNAADYNSPQAVKDWYRQGFAIPLPSLRIGIC
jgi:hypothetical protein